MNDQRVAFFVLGPESSGTRLATRILIEGGCAGEAGHAQRFDHEPFSGDRVVLRRSLPHRHDWADPRALAFRAEQEGYAPAFVLTARSTSAMVASQLRTGHVQTAEQAQSNIIRALRVMTEVRYFYLLVYEALVLYPAAEQQALLRWARLNEKVPTIDIYDGNEKHLKEA